MECRGRKGKYGTTKVMKRTCRIVRAWYVYASGRATEVIPYENHGESFTYEITCSTLRKTLSPGVRMEASPVTCSTRSLTIEMPLRPVVQAHDTCHLHGVPWPLPAQHNRHSRLLLASLDKVTDVGGAAEDL